MERRKHPRKRVDRPLAIRDLNRDIELGRLVDISLDGLMLLSREDVPSNRVYPLALKIPEELGYGPWAEFGAESLWTETSLEPERYWVGFHIIDISQENQDRIRGLIDAI